MLPVFGLGRQDDFVYLLIPSVTKTPGCMFFHSHQMFDSAGCVWQCFFLSVVSVGLPFFACFFDPVAPSLVVRCYVRCFVEPFNGPCQSKGALQGSCKVASIFSHDWMILSKLCFGESLK
jgi:hypothetical protein